MVTYLFARFWSLQDLQNMNWCLIRCPFVPCLLYFEIKLPAHILVKFVTVHTNSIMGVLSLRYLCVNKDL